MKRQLAVAVGLLLSAGAMGQTVSTSVKPGDGQGSQAQTEASRQAPVPPLPPGRARLSEVSYFAVPAKEPRTIKKHDLVTIIVSERSESTTEGKTDLKKDYDLDAAITSYLTLHGLNLGSQTPDNPIAMKLAGSRNFKGEATVENRDSFVTRITAEVVDVKPNGNLVMQARKHIRTDEEDQEYVLSGVCRATDITADNTVLSTQLYDLDLQKTNKGAMRDTNKRGIIPKLLDRINPF